MTRQRKPENVKQNVKEKVKNTVQIPSARRQKQGELLSLISESVPFRQIALLRQCSLSAVYRMFYRLKERNLIDEKKHLTPQGIQEVINVKKSLVVSHDVQENLHRKQRGHPPDTIRLHDLQFTIHILKKPDNWEQHRQTILKLKNIAVQDMHLHHTLVQEFYINNIRIRTTNKSVLVLIDDVYADTPIMAKNKAIRLLERVIPHIERLFTITLEKPRILNINITRQQNALIFNEIAKQFLDAGLQLHIYDNDGVLRLIIDDSQKLNELEAISVVHSEDDATEVKLFLRDLILNRHYTLSDLSQKMSSLVTSIELLSKLAIQISRSQHATTESLQVAVKLQETMLRALQIQPQKPTPPPAQEQGKSTGKPSYVG